MAAESSATSAATYPIKTVVVLVQENRSFDHMLGWFKTLNPEINGVTGQESNPISTSDTNSTLVSFKDQSAYVDPDPGHSIQAIYEQVYGVQWTEAALNNPQVVKMNGFAQNAERTQQGMSTNVMSGFRPEAVPVYKELAVDFAICDRWFASVPASTQPNRLYVHSATSHGLTSNDAMLLVEGLPQKTVFESLDESGFSFGIYFQQLPSTLIYRNMRKIKYLKNFHQFDQNFKKHCEEGKLPNYVVIEPIFFDLLSKPANDDHPSHDISEGQNFVKEVYELLRASPQWNEMLFVIVYDEHGGFYDHVPTPATGIPNPDDIVGPEPHFFEFDRLGVRVPAFLISPWIEPGTVLHGPSGPDSTSEYEHSSIPATLKKLFNLKEFLTKRDAWAGTFETVLTRTSPRTDCPVTLAEPVKLRSREANEEADISEFQQELVQLAAVLNGDCATNIYPYRLVESMKVSEAANYVENAYKTFYEEYVKARDSGLDESQVISIVKTRESLAIVSNGTTSTSKTFIQKLFSCLICDY
ncbi:non-specific phospholipase C4-like [Mercurialis annua]|uniref:non-specific phospholipase C4-like n=1 Tax=Mercurialis annua TaxID=3986 RepID=UPI00215F6456|nr:non-specific phospholipase C4-like [Mercurialis annua]